MNIAELFIKLGVSGGDKAISTLANLTKSIGQAGASAKMGALQLSGMATGLLYFTDKAAQVGMELTRFSNLTGLSATELQRWQIAASETGTSAEEMAGALENLQKQQTAVRMGLGGDVGAFSYFGLDMGANALQNMEKLRQKMQGGDRQKNVFMAERLGMSPTLINSLIEMKKAPPTDGLILSDKERQRLTQFAKEFNRFMLEGKIFLTRLAADFMPLAKWVMRFMDSLRKDFTALKRLVDMASKSVGGIKTAILIAAAAMAFAFAPVTAGVMAFLLVLDDVMGYFQGKDSVTGRIIAMFKNGDFIKNFPILGYFKDWNEASDTLKFSLQALWEILKDIGGWTWDVGKALGANAWEAIKGMAISLGEAMGVMSYQSQSAGVRRTPETPMFSYPGLAGAVAGGGPSTYNVTNNIYGATDAHQTAKIVTDRIQSQTSETQYQLPRKEH